MKTISMLAAVSAVAAVTLSVPARSGQVDALGTPLVFFLASQGAGLNLNFTFEEDKRTIGNVVPLSPIETARIPSPPVAITTKADLISILRVDLPADQIESDSRYPSVIHIIDKSLASGVGNPLDLVISKFEYTGPLYQLPDNLGQCLSKNLFSSRSMSPTDLLFADYKSQAAISASSLSCREILTEARHGTSVDRINWKAETMLVSGANNTFVYFNVAPGSPDKQQ